jgi:hypothetical protein
MFASTNIFKGLKTSFYSIEKQLSSVAKTAIQIGELFGVSDVQVIN